MSIRRETVAGLQAEGKILKSGIRDIFTPHTPISRAELFFGRTEQVQSLLQALGTPGQHCVLYGERGVGKSSLANVVSSLLIHGSKQINVEIRTVRCDSTSSFESIFTTVLKSMHISLAAPEVTSTKTESGKAGLNIAVANAGVDTTTSTSTKIVPQQIVLSPSVVAELLSEKTGLLVIDEFDALPRKRDKERIAEVIKQLSDVQSTFKLLIVGIGETCGDLLAGHPSVQRCLKDVKLSTMRKDEIQGIITNGAKRARLQFENDVVRSIVELSAGYPYFTHLLCLKCAERAVIHDYRKVNMHRLEIARESAMRDAEGSLQEQYKAATRSSNPRNIYREILKAGAGLPPEFSNSDLKEQVELILKRKQKPNELSKALARLTSHDASNIFKRQMRGVYRFSDTRMRSFIRICSP